MDVGVATEPPLRIHVRPAPQPQRELLLTRLDRDPLAQRLILIATRDVDQDLAARQPALTAAVDVGVRDLAKTKVAADVDVPGAQVRIDVVVVTVRLVGHAPAPTESAPGRPPADWSGHRA